VLTRDRYDLILAEMVRDGVRAESGDSNFGLDYRQVEQMKNMRQRFRVKKLVGGQTELLRIFGPHPKRYYAETANYPKVVCDDELFDIIWTAHHKNGHMKTPQALQKNIQNDGIWGVPRPAVKIFVVGCLVCARNTSVTKQVPLSFSSLSLVHARTVLYWDSTFPSHSFRRATPAPPFTRRPTTNVAKSTLSVGVSCPCLLPIVCVYVIRLLPIVMKYSRHVYLVLDHVLPCSFQHEVCTPCPLEYV
jgi:hypothetical protein